VRKPRERLDPNIYDGPRLRGLREPYMDPRKEGGSEESQRILVSTTIAQQWKARNSRGGKGLSLQETKMTEKGRVASPTIEGKGGGRGRSGSRSKSRRLRREEKLKGKATR